MVAVRLLEALVYSAQALLPDRARPRGLSWLVFKKLAREDARGPAEEVERRTPWKCKVVFLLSTVNLKRDAD